MSELEEAEVQLRVQALQAAAADAWRYFEALTEVGFLRLEALQIVVAWVGKPPGIDAATAADLIDRLKVE